MEKDAPSAHEILATGKTKVILDYMGKKYPKMSEKMRIDLTQMVIEHDAEITDPELTNAIADNRLQMQDTIDTEPPPSELKELKEILGRPGELVVHIGRIELLLESMKKSVNLKTLPQFQSIVKDCFRNIIRYQSEDIELMVILFASGSTNSGTLVNFDTEIEEALIQHIEDGNLDEAFQITDKLNDCRAIGYRGKSFHVSLESLPAYREAMEMGLEVAKQTGSAEKVQLYRAQNRKSGTVKKTKDALEEIDLNNENASPFEALG
jgi:hypothetical protein